MVCHYLFFYVVYNEMHNFTVFLLFKLAGQDLIIYIVLQSIHVLSL